MKKFILSIITIFSFFVTTNVNSQDEVNSIQALINSAELGEVVNVPEGNYEESLIINQSISLIANGEVVLNVSGLGTGILINNDVSDVVIEGFTITGDNLTGSGITVNPGAANITLEDNNIENNYTIHIR